MKKNSNMMVLEILIPDISVSDFMFQLSATLGTHLRITSLLPSDAEELINFTCEVDEDFFVTFRNLYEKFYHKKFTINYTGNKIE